VSAKIDSDRRDSIVALIPARYAATRFPAKLMQILGDRTIVRRTYEAVRETGLFDEVIVVTDSDLIYEEIQTHGGRALMSGKEHESGSDRIAEAAAGLDADIIVNVQADEPFIQAEPLQRLVELFDDPFVQVGSLMRKISDYQVLNDPNCVKVVVNKNMDALYFSRSVIPYPRNNKIAVEHFLHIGVYAFRKQTLLDFTGWPAAATEAAEKLEQLRYLENGIPIRMALTNFEGIAIDTPADLARAARFL
jgi:3-deoxy-manno-octulosonate cytidylyltransferase (CMP-KDO synthetase)